MIQTAKEIPSLLYLRPKRGQQQELRTTVVWPQQVAQTLKKLGEVQRIEETAQRRKMASIIAEVNSNVAAAIASNANFASESIDEAIGAISKAKTAA